jgi:hypothetical protein
VMPSLRWHDPDQVRRSKVENLPLSPAHRTPVFDTEYTPKSSPPADSWWLG